MIRYVKNKNRDYTNKTKNRYLNWKYNKDPLKFVSVSGRRILLNFYVTIKKDILNRRKQINGLNLYCKDVNRLILKYVGYG